MTRKEYLQEISKCEINNDKAGEIGRIYGQELPTVLKQIISYSDNSIFFDDGWRILAISEVMDAEQDLHVEFVKLGIIPVADCGENDFVVYHFTDAIWSKFNIIDECTFKKKSSIEELF